ncbi:MAG: MerR family transcriptional regulator [Desulfobacteraceae bacterium]|nr:MerR family transcriptional regulator [Desulfobacteraceae bacterium]
MENKEKRYYRIGEVSRLTGVDQHVLRYWEGEFREIRPRRVAKQRLYRAEDIKIIERIKDLLYKDGFTIAGAKKRLMEDRNPVVSVQAELFPDTCCKAEPEAILEDIRRGLVSIKKMLEGAER